MSNQPEFPDSPQHPVDSNPYAATLTDAETLVASDDVEAYRQRYLAHEASVKSIGTLYLLGAFLLTLIGLTMVVTTAAAGEFLSVGLLVGAIYVVLGTLQGFVGYGLRRLQRWARIGAILFSVVGLLGIPIGTLISVYFLYLLLSEKGRIVFSDEYQRVIEQTPHMRYKTSLVVWIFLILLVIAFAAMIAMVAIG